MPLSGFRRHSLTLWSAAAARGTLLPLRLFRLPSRMRSCANPSFRGWRSQSYPRVRARKFVSTPCPRRSPCQVPCALSHFSSPAQPRADSVAAWLFFFGAFLFFFFFFFFNFYTS